MCIYLCVHQRVKKASSCAPLDSAWRRVDFATAWMTARMRAMRSSAVSRLWATGKEMGHF